ncbi:MAG: site-specific integrase [Lachnospiraceae bacterium]|nr:site-specific integrase [Lachnospiraceae bacterium]
MRPAFAMAKKNRWVVDNPFDFPMLKKRYGGTKTRDALSKADMRRFLDFVRTDKHFRVYFNGVFILFNTGLRISEFCGLTPGDIDFQNHVIHVRRQLLRIHDGDRMMYYIEIPKTDNGIRDVPMLADVETAFREVMAARPQRDVEPVVWNEEHTDSASGFLWLDKNGGYEVAQHWENHLRWARAKFNRIYKDEIPPVTPHVCRHTFCSNCASIGMSPKTLQMIMGHASIEFTLNVYTHLEAGDIKGEFFSLMNNKAYNFYPLDRTPETVAPDIGGDEDEGEPDMDAAPDDDE